MRIESGVSRRPLTEDGQEVHLETHECHDTASDKNNANGAMRILIHDDAAASSVHDLLVLKTWLEHTNTQQQQHTHHAPPTHTHQHSHQHRPHTEWSTRLSASNPTLSQVLPCSCAEPPPAHATCSCTFQGLAFHRAREHTSLCQCRSSRFQRVSGGAPCDTSKCEDAVDQE